MAGPAVAAMTRNTPLRELIVHVGGPKTGSTQLQFRLARGREALLEAGLDYPERAPNWGTPRSMGNVPDLRDDPGALEDAVSLADPRATRGVLVSSELLLRHLFLQPDALERMARDAVRLGFDRLRLLLVIRDPMELAPSNWQQYVRGPMRLAVPLDRWTAEDFDTPQQVASVLSQAEASPLIERTVLNFSRSRAETPARILAALGLDPQDPAFAPSVVELEEREGRNPSLSIGETTFLRAFNAASPGAPGLLGFASELRSMPGRATRARRPSADAQRAALVRLAPALDAIDALVPEAERPRRDVLPGDEGLQTVEIFEGQLHHLGDAAGRIVAELHAKSLEADRLRRHLARIEPAAKRYARLRGLIPGPLRRLLGGG